MSQRSRGPAVGRALNDQVGAVIEQQRDLALHPRQSARPEDRVRAAPLARRRARRCRRSCRTSVPPCAPRPSASAAPAAPARRHATRGHSPSAATRAGNPRWPIRAAPARRTAARSAAACVPVVISGHRLLAELPGRSRPSTATAVWLRLCASIPITIHAVSPPSGSFPGSPADSTSSRQRKPSSYQVTPDDPRTRRATRLG